MKTTLFSAAILLVAAAAPARATGSLDCKIDDNAVKLTASAIIPHGMGSPTLDFKADLMVSDQAIAEDLRIVSFDAGNRPQYWNDGEEVRMVLYKERTGAGPFGSVELSIRTRAPDGDDSIVQSGIFKLSIFDAATGGNGDTKEITGAVTCSVE